MILTRSGAGRQFIGRLDSGADLVESLEEVCRQHGIVTCEFRGSGYFESARLYRYDPSKRALTLPDAAVAGPLTVTAAHGTASQKGKDTEVHIYGTLVDGRGNTYGGRIAAARVLTFEFTISSYDDIVLIRSADKNTGLDQWLQVRAPGESTPLHAEANAQPDEAANADEAHELDEVITNPGDILEHPRFGRCVVVHQPDEDRVTVRLENQRTVDLHLGLVRLSIVRRDGDATVYRARILRKP
jgi:predicted DNA-binding protein with PD1-like motif